MIELTGKQKRHLRGLGQKVPALLAVGKAGVTDGITAAAAELLATRELIKVRLPAGPAPARKAVAQQLADTTGASCAGVVGRTALLYRPAEALPPEQRIVLPDP